MPWLGITFIIKLHICVCHLAGIISSLRNLHVHLSYFIIWRTCLFHVYVSGLNFLCSGCRDNLDSNSILENSLIAKEKIISKLNMELHNLETTLSNEREQHINEIKILNVVIKEKVDYFLPSCVYRCILLCFHLDLHKVFSSSRLVFTWIESVKILSFNVNVNCWIIRLY